MEFHISLGKVETPCGSLSSLKRHDTGVVRSNSKGLSRGRGLCEWMVNVNCIAIDGSMLVSSHQLL